VTVRQVAGIEGIPVWALLAEAPRPRAVIVAAPAPLTGG